MAKGKCDGVTLKGRLCNKAPSVIVETTEGRRIRYCRQHADGKGVMRLLRPYPWDIARELGIGRAVGLVAS